MSVTLDGQKLFDERPPVIEVGSAQRASIERAAAGLDGVLSIDMGRRSRQIRQAGELWARSRADLDRRVEAVSAFMDGRTHTLVTSSGEEFENLRMDSFKVKDERVSGGGLVADYEIIYTQLGE